MRQTPVFFAVIVLFFGLSVSRAENLASVKVPVLASRYIGVPAGPVANLVVSNFLVRDAAAFGVRSEALSLDKALRASFYDAIAKTGLRNPQGDRDVWQAKAGLDSFFDNSGKDARSGASAFRVLASGKREYPAANGIAAGHRLEGEVPALPSSGLASAGNKVGFGFKGFLSGVKQKLSHAVLRLLGRRNGPPVQDPDSEANGELKDRFWVSVKATTRSDRTRISELGVAIEDIHPDRVEGTARQEALGRLEKAGFSVLKAVSLSDVKPEDFPPDDSPYHNYDEMLQEMKALAASHPELVSLFSIGKTNEGRDIWGIRLNTSAKGAVKSEKPGVVFMGAHHAREHLSVEVPLLLAKHLAEAGDEQTRKLLDARDIFIIPMANPDGAEYDIASGRYKMWRKNRSKNQDGSYGVDLNRNYGYKWGTGGSSDDPSDETYMGSKPFSEPETQNIKKFVDAHANLKILLTFHSFSELILYPWGHTYDPIQDEKARKVHEIMARKMAGWNGYTPQQSSDLYITSGDTTDWAYGEKRLIAFTFELTPKSMWEGGFYPGPKAIQSAYEKNLKPALYLIENADDPYKVLKPGA